jgi:crotonobetainyl-CoA:carnitine CoA-transferase CaiB-like acyl-CoA transferase
MGEDSWLAIAVTNDDQWRALCDVIRRPDLARGARFATGPSRVANRAEADAIVAGWVATQSAHGAQVQLMQAGVPAGEVLTVGSATRNEHLLARDMYPTSDHPVVGEHFTFAMPPKFIRTDVRTGGRSPLFSEHTREVLQRLAGLTNAEYEAFEAEGVVAKRPENVDLR